MYGGRNHYNHSHQPHHHYPNYNHKGGPPPGAVLSPESAQASEIFDKFTAASTFKLVLQNYQLMCNVLRLRPTNIRHFYPKLKSKIRSWKAVALWTKFDKRAAHKCYNHGKNCNDTKVLIIGAGPCGLRAAIEAQLLGAKVVVVEKRDRFSRNNVLHLWPFVIADLKALGAKKFYGKFCAGAIDHISIRQLQCILLKVALLLGVEVFEGVGFEELLEPPEDQSQRIGYHARFSPSEHPVNQYEFDVLIGADGKRNTLMGFKRKEFRGKLAIAITANFINKRTEQEARVQEISGVAFIFNQKFFKDLYQETGIDLENIVYYKDETHYFVMTAKKHSLIDKGVILRDLPDTQQLLHPNNVDREALCSYAREAADFSTGYQMPHLDFAFNHYGKPDIAMFDFTSMFAAENASRIHECRGHKLLKCLVGDSLLEPFWPTGSGCARGFLSSFDACWAIRSWASNKMTPLEVIAERESIYRLLNQTTPENLGKDFSSYTLDPSSRYPTVNLKVLLPFQVRHLMSTDNNDSSNGDTDLTRSVSADDLPRKRKRADSLIQPDTLLGWCQKQVAQHPQVKILDFETSFNDGLAFCAIIHRYRPDLLDFESLSDRNTTHNFLLAFDILERLFAIAPILSPEDLTNDSICLNRTSLISFVSQVHDVFRGEIPQSMGSKPSLQEVRAKDSDKIGMEDFPPQTKPSNDLDSIPPEMTQSLPVTTARISSGNIEEAKLSSLDSSQTIKKRRNEVDNLDAKENNEVSDRTFHRMDSTDEFSDRIKGLEAKFKSGAPMSSQHKPKDMIRAIGKLEKSDWNMSAIERKIEENPRAAASRGDREKVPKWTKDNYNDKFQNIERRLRENGEDEERIAKYLDIDASLKRLERKLREGSTLETGLRGHNKVSNLASQLSSKWSRKDDTKIVASSNKHPRTVILPSTDSDLCYFCGTRVYLVERLNAEGKFFHRQCFKCCYCGALLRLGNYIYDRENRYGGKFFCIPHFGLTARSRAKKPEQNREKIPPTRTPPSFYARTPEERTDGGVGMVASKNLRGDLKGVSPLMSTPVSKMGPPSLASLMDDRGTTPERVEFENSLIEHSDEEEYLSEDEWTDRNFGASANELDEHSDDSDYSDLSDEEIDEEVLESSHQLTAAETRRLAESWKRRYSKNELDLSDRESMSDSEEDLSEEQGADGDESHTATEGENGDYEDDEEEDDERAKRAREVRRLELNINVDAPPRKAETSDSGSDTEVASDEESDTQIDTDSEFAEDESSRKPKEIPMIVIDEIPKEATTKDEESSSPPKDPKAEYIEQTIDLGSNEGEKSSSLTDLTKSSQPNPFTEQLKRLLQRTESTEAVTAQRSQLKRNYMMGSSNYSPKKSVSSADIGDRFKNFMDKISATQKKLQPAPEPSPAMQAFLNSSSKNNSPSHNGNTPMAGLSSFPLLSRHSTSSVVNGSEDAPPPSSSGTKSPPTEESSETSKSEEGKLFSFPAKNSKTISSSVSDYDNLTPKQEENFGETEPQQQQIAKNEKIDAKNFALIDTYEREEKIDNQSEKSILVSTNHKIILDNELSGSSKDDGTILNLEIVSNKNLKNVNIDSILLDGASINDIDECFDQLANEAILELNSSKVLVPSVHSDEFGDSLELSPKVSNESIDNNFNINSEVPEEELNISTNKMDESGFKSMDDNKTLAEEKSEEVTLSNKIDQLQSPETAGDISDWADDQEVITENDLKDELKVILPPVIPPPPPHCDLLPPIGILRARMASLESLEDSDSAIYVGIPKAPLPLVSTRSDASITKESENMDFMDTSGSESSQDADNTFSYDHLEEDALATPSTPVAPPTPIEDKTRKPIKSKSMDVSVLIKNNSIPDTSTENSLVSSSAENSLTGSESSKLFDSQCEKTSTPKKYGGYIPRFKDRRTPLSLARDSIDVRKTSASKPLFTPSKEDILQRHQNEKELLSASSSSSVDKKKVIKPKDGDLVKDLVMSRISSRQSPDKTTRRGSRNAFQLSINNSSSSLFGSELSLSTNAATPPPVTQEPREGGHPLTRCSTVPSARPSSITSPRSVLPATPLTHPERFRAEEPLLKKELFKSTPHLPSAEPPPPELPARAPYISTEHLNASSTSAPTAFFSKPQQLRASIRAQSESPLPTKKDSRKDPEERLKELLAERKRKENEEQRREVRMRNKDSCLKECLQEYRLKRNSAPGPQDLNLTNEKPPDLELANRTTRRPSRLDIEAMQVFLTAPPLPLPPPLRSRASSFSSVLPTSSQNLQMSPNPSACSPPLTSPGKLPCIVGSTETPATNKRPVKKSKDRERRRSLIQVFAGMFSKSEEKKKSPEDDVDLNTSQSSSTMSASPSPASVVAPKSPSVKERFSKLRLSRSKKKGQTDDKNRSASVDESQQLNDSKSAPPNSLSLPTSPSRTIFSFLGGSPSKAEKRKKSASGPSASPQGGQLYHSSSIKEEVASEEEMGQMRDTLPSTATPSARRQKAVMRAVKQAEQKRLRMAQEIQRQLEECEVKTRDLEEKGIKVEKTLIGETKGSCRAEPELMKDWFRLVHEKNALVRWQEELTIKAKELELEDRHVRLENELRQRMTCSDTEKTREDIDREGKILAEIISVIDQKDALTNLLEEDRQRYIEEDKDLQEVQSRKILQRSPFERETGV